MPAELFRRGARKKLDAFLKRLNDHTEAEHFLTDGRGVDLVTGEDRSALRMSGPSTYRSTGLPYCPGPKRRFEFAGRATVDFG